MGSHFAYNVTAVEFSAQASLSSCLTSFSQSNTEQLCILHLVFRPGLATFDDLVNVDLQAICHIDVQIEGFDHHGPGVRWRCTTSQADGHRSGGFEKATATDRPRRSLILQPDRQPQTRHI